MKVPFEICVASESVLAHMQNHGDTEGECPARPDPSAPCPEACDQTCPSACLENATVADGFDCWDLNRSRACDLATEDENGDQVCDALDCQGSPGVNGTDGQDGADGMSQPDGQDGRDGLRCWDLNGNGVCDLTTEDIDMDGFCTLSDCQGPSNCTCPQGGDGGQDCECPGTVKLCCFIAIVGSFTPLNPNPTGVATIGQLRWLAHKDCTVPNFLDHVQCNGQLLAVGQNVDLFAHLGIKYGSTDGGRTNFRLPDFRGMKTWKYMM